MSFGPKIEILDNRLQTGERVCFFAFLNSENSPHKNSTHYGRWVKGNTHMGTAVFTDGKWATGYGGVQVIPGEITADTMFEIVRAEKRGRVEGFSSGYEAAQRDMRSALGL